MTVLNPDEYRSGQSSSAILTECVLAQSPGPPLEECPPHPVRGLWVRVDSPLPREEAAFPAPWTLKRGKFGPTVTRVDHALGDRKLKASIAKIMRAKGCFD
eukprot:CAMPEP_0204035618 /NCGR_PEP_ID=MMETSP0360-20130528/76782_1 /ASSEMBLY_ACC=CAM_ASM_000342 /TAXON_ID=268821 /ORGANISM="Scrippsiella Hangoei, Strain SHTV-5" /LENGTH=100 /DNA_ID=CAMNT_0050980655 /DNA_START=83 /DNA_END=384 /DNA_ORIENTATION=-